MTKPPLALRVAPLVGPFVVAIVVAIGVAIGAAAGLAACGGDQRGEPDAQVGVPGACEPATQVGCAAGDKCTWIRTAASPAQQAGQLGCVPAGTGEVGAACLYGATGATTGYDDCGAGLICLASPGADRAQGTCRAICDDGAAAAGPGACAADWACGEYVSFFQNGQGPARAGICDPTCDPLAQTRDYDGAAACGSVEGGRQQGCYGNIPTLFDPDPPEFTCSIAAGTAGHREPAADPETGGVYRNGCAPGHIIGLVKSSQERVEICTRMCEPVETHAGAPGGARGSARHGCPDGSECRYWWFFDDSRDVNPFFDSLGLCLAHGEYTYDPDLGNATVEAEPLPSCAAVSSQDDELEPGDLDPDNTTPEYLEWGCGPYPASATEGATARRRDRQRVLILPPSARQDAQRAWPSRLP